jgi:predicted ATPase/DNA-binding CsgD family transcriptional regulator
VTQVTVPAEVSPLNPIDRATNLPVQLTTFVGREQELAQVRRLVAGSRLLTLTGSGGVGKTRLTLQAATDLVADYPDGVWLVELASVADAALLPQTVASALGVGEASGHDLTDTLTAFLRARRLLLVLDNCEHLLDACAELADHLLRTCPRVQILATSRQRLGMAGETAWRVPSLATPDIRTVAGTDEIAASEAVRLFLDRARMTVPAFVLEDRNAVAVARICRRLDGIPLAIELAAARVSVLAPEQIAARLDDCFQLLVGGSRTAPSRQRTLRATVDWSYDLLSEPERALFRRLSVFAGGFSLEAAEAVCTGDGIARTDVLDLLAALIDKSLVAADSGDSSVVRYRLLETLRHYGWERLAESNNRDAVQRRHADHFLELVEFAEPQLVGTPEQGAWLDRLERDHGNFRAALQWAIDARQSETGVRLAAALYRLWYLRGYLGEGRHWSNQVLAWAQDAPRTATARALRGAGLLAYAAGDYPEARAFTEQGLALAREIEDKRLISAALNNLGIILIDQGDYPAAHAACEEGLALARELADEPFVAVLLNNLGLLAGYRADYAAAIPLLEESLAIAQARGMQWSMAWSTGNLGNAAFHRGDFAAARERYRQSLALGQEVGDKRVIAERLEELAWVACAERQPELAVRLFGAAEVLRETIGAPMPPANRAQYDRSVDLARAQVGDVRLAAMWAHGRALPLEQAIAAALSSDVGDQLRGTNTQLPGHLTQREQEVAELVARGLSNREIATTLVVSVRTAEAHITHLLNKLELRSRAQLAVWAVKHGFLTRGRA